MTFFELDLNTLVLISHVSPYALYDGKLGNNSSFAQCFGRVILHNYQIRIIKYGVQAPHAVHNQILGFQNRVPSVKPVFRFWERPKPVFGFGFGSHNCVHCKSAGGGGRNKRRRRPHRVLIW